MQARCLRVQVPKPVRHLKVWMPKYLTSFSPPVSRVSWWRHQMETFSALLAIWVTGEFPTQRPVIRSFDVFFDMRLNKRLSKQSWGFWFETPSRPLWRHCNLEEHNVLSTSTPPQQIVKNRVSLLSHLYVSACGLAPWGARSSTDTIIPQFACVFTELVPKQ